MALLGYKAKPVGDESLEKWEPVGSGGFGYVYKARHKDWGFDVAIKILQDGVCPLMTLDDEANHMDKASCEFVLRRYGTYHGCPPGGWTSKQHGLVMEYMKLGSVESLRVLSGPPPWPLVFRLAHQVALGMNFLHSQGLMHHDLKPNNVLLDKDLNAKLADFGLSRVPTSVLNNTETLGDTTVPGTCKYMPPEAFEVSYEPVRDFDRYRLDITLTENILHMVKTSVNSVNKLMKNIFFSLDSYGILLWSLVTGKEPYPSANSALVRASIPDGGRPSLKEIDQTKAEGLKELVELMQRCWDQCPSKRPTFRECCEITETEFSKHSEGIRKAVDGVLTRLESGTGRRSNTSMASNESPQTKEQPESMEFDTVDRGRQESQTSRRPNTSMASNVSLQTQEQPVDHGRQDCASVSSKIMSDADKANFVDDNRAQLIRGVTEVVDIVEDLGKIVHRATYDNIIAAKTSRDKTRLLYDRTLVSEGQVAKAAFYDALKIHHPELMKRLGGL